MKRESLPKLVRPTETVNVDVLGGAVQVQALDLAQYQTFWTTLSQAKAGEAPATFKGSMALLLSMSVVDDDGRPLADEAYWSEFGGSWRANAIALHEVAWRLSDMDGQAAKKDSGPTQS